MGKITIIPAIDLKNGKCVRLTQGRADAEKIYSEDPVAMALQWQKDGAKWLHVVDLDGAFNRKPMHTKLIGQIASATRMSVEAGGGIRTTGDIRALLDAGVKRVILGTWACEDPSALEDLAREYGSALAVGIDAKDGIVVTKGWTESAGVKAVDLARTADKAGIRTLIVTDTAVDGMLTGVNAPAMDAVCSAVRCEVIASGGVTSSADIIALKKLNRPNLCGAIVGKALYEGRVTLKELIRTSEDSK